MEGAIYKDNSLVYDSYEDINEKQHTTIILDGTFKIEQLEAIIWWMKNKTVGKKGGE